MAAYLNADLRVRDPSAIAATLDSIARSKRMTQLSKGTSIVYDRLHNALMPMKNPSFDTVAAKIFELKLDIASASA